MQNEIEYIKSRLDERELLTRLAEEAAELTQAALKLRRALDDNPDTPVTVEEAQANLFEEYCDVLNIVNILGFADDDLISVRRQMHEEQEKKLRRWVKRLEAMQDADD